MILFLAKGETFLKKRERFVSEFNMDVFILNEIIVGGE